MAENRCHVVLCPAPSAENSSPTMSDLYNWLHPVKLLANEARAIPALVGLIKESVDAEEFCAVSQCLM